MAKDANRYQSIKDLLDAAHRSQKRTRPYKDSWARAQDYLDTKSDGERKSIEIDLRDADDPERRDWLRQHGSP